MEAVRGFPITRRSGERYGSYDQSVISVFERSTSGGPFSSWWFLKNR
jgi:hypothetical protein